MEPIDKIFFFHNPKAGGAFLLDVLNQIYPGKACPNIENNVADHQRQCADFSRFKGYQIYSGHYGRDVFDVVSQGHLPITNFRNPINRIVSLYNYFRITTKLPENIVNLYEYSMVREAKSYSFYDYVRSNNPVTNIYLRNMHSRQLTNSLYMDSIPNMSLARDFIDSMPWFFISEYSQASLEWSKRVLGWPTVENRKINVTAIEDGYVHIEEIDDGTINMISEMNMHDIDLYHHAVNLFEERVLTQAA